MLGITLSAKVAAAILAGLALVTGGAAVHGSVALHAEHSSTPAAREHTNGQGNGQGAVISALAHSTVSGPDKGAVISAVAKLHGPTVSAHARANVTADTSTDEK